MQTIRVVVLGMLPAAYYALGLIADTLGANPLETLTRGMGRWALYFLLFTLAITPVQRLFGAPGLLRLRRPLGLLAFLYASLHLVCYLWLDQSFDLPAILSDLGERPVMALGMAAYLLLIPLAATSTAAAFARLGGPRWRRLHGAIYPSAVLAVLHDLWLAKTPALSPILPGALLALLLGLRLWWACRDEPLRRASRQPSPPR